MPAAKIPEDRAEGSSTTTDLATQIARLADQLRRLPESRLRRRHDGLDGRTAADAAHGLAQWLADAAANADLDTGSAASRMVPRLSDLAVGDQVAVTGMDLVAALEELDQSATTASLVSEALRRVGELGRLA